MNNCLKCGKCCYGEMGPFIFPTDVSRLAAYLDIESWFLLSNFCEEHSLEFNMIAYKVYTIKLDKGHCVFLRSNLCTIFQERPYQCKYAPFEFLATYEIWKHMVCVNEFDFVKVSSTENDLEIFSELLVKGYTNLERR